MTNEAAMKKAREVIENFLDREQDFSEDELVQAVAQAFEEYEQRGRESRDEPSREEINAFLEPAPNCEVNWDEWDTGFREGAKWALNWRKK